MQLCAFKCPRGARLSVVALLWLVSVAVLRAAGPFTVNTTLDSHATSPASSPNDSSGHISLRSAIEAANSQPGATTINVPAGTYNLTLGELAVFPNGHGTNAILGAGAASTVIIQTDGSNRVFDIDINSVGSTLVTLSGLTIQGGQDGADGLGGAGILAGSVTSVPKDSLTLNNCVIQNNHCRATTTQEPGGGIQMAGGDLVLSSCTFSNNSSGQSFGGAVFVLAQTVVSSLSVTNSAFLSNSLTNNSGAGPDGGGAITIMTPSGSAHTIVDSTFNGNRALGNAGATYGGAIQLNGGSLTVLNSTFLSNSVTGQSGVGGLGGAFYVDSGLLNLSFSRLFANTATYGGSAVYNHGSNGGNTIATNDWWGCNGGPGPAGCAVLSADGGTTNYSPWLVLNASASPAVIGRGQTSTITATVLTNSLGQALTPAQLPVLLGLPLVWNGVTHGTLSTPQATLQPSGQASATFTNDNTCNVGTVNVSLDGGTATATVLVQCPDLVVTKANNVSGAATVGNPWTWTVHVANAGPVAATFANGNAILLDNLPTGNVGYGSPTLANVTGVTGTMLPALDGSGNVTLIASGAVTLAAGSAFDVQVSGNANAMGTFINPRPNGVCMADPNNVLFESSKANNSATNTVVVTCPVVTATMGGGGPICAGGSAIVSVNVSGGVPPYSITLNNGGGTHAGSSPLFFTVSPGATTTYQVSSGTDANGCSVNNSGSATVTVNPLPVPTITTGSSSVLANSAGNQASGPAGYNAYAWTIQNGLITGPTNQPVATFVAGGSNNILLTLTVVNANGCVGSASVNVPVTTGFSVHTNVTFTDGLTGTTTGIAFDGTNYWSCSGSSTSGTHLARYTSSGVLLATYAPGIDFRSVFTRPDGTLLARGYNSGIIYQQTSPGTFVNSGVTLTGGTLNAQSSVVLNAAATEYQAMSSGVVSRWSTSGAYLGSVNLLGYGALSGENSSTAQNHGLAVVGSYWLTFTTNTLSLWDTNGNRVLQASTLGAGATFDSFFGFAFCNGKLFVVDVAGGKWRGFDLYSAPAVSVLGAEGNSTWTTDVTTKIAGPGFLPRVDFARVTSGDPVPTLTQLRGYQAVMVFSDAYFNDQVAMGNVLADYLDQGGGVVFQTFVFATNAPYGIQGRVVTGGYLPLTESVAAYPVNLTLVEDQPTHPMLDGVASFNGGSTSYQNAPVSLTAGAVQLGHWSNAQPLVAAKDVSPGHSAALNFFPPSNDAFSSSWVSSTDGARLMADALAWSGRIPPVIVSGPADQVVGVGGSASFRVVARGVSALGYQWRLNGTNLPGATTTSLNFTVGSSSAGPYSVVVSNLYGATTSLGATLSPPLRFLTPARLSGTGSLLLATVDGSAVATNRAARVRLYQTTNLATPWSAWTVLPNPVVASNGLLRVDGLSLASPTQFFRAAETP